MKLVIFGATGGTGQQLVQQALEQGHEVTAFMRHPEKFKMPPGRLSVVKGDALNATAVENVVTDQDAVLVALGTKPPSQKAVVGPGTKNILVAMKKHSVHRVIVESAHFMDEAVIKNSFLTSLLIRTFLKGLYADKVVQESAVRASGLEWVIVRPAGLTNGHKTKIYRFGENLQLKGVFPTISRADVADFMLKQLNSESNLHKALLVAR